MNRRMGRILAVVVVVVGGAPGRVAGAHGLLGRAALIAHGAPPATCARRARRSARNRWKGQPSRSHSSISTRRSTGWPGQVEVAAQHRLAHELGVEAPGRRDLQHLAGRRAPPGRRARLGVNRLRCSGSTASDAAPERGDVEARGVGAGQQQQAARAAAGRGRPRRRRPGRAGARSPRSRRPRRRRAARRPPPRPAAPRSRRRARGTRRPGPASARRRSRARSPPAPGRRRCRSPGPISTSVPGVTPCSAQSSSRRTSRGRCTFSRRAASEAGKISSRPEAVGLDARVVLGEVVGRGARASCRASRSPGRRPT